MTSLERFYLYFDNERDRRLEKYTSNASLDHMTFNHLLYLEAIWKMESATLSELANRLEVSKPSVTNMINRLIKEGFVEKKPSSEDKRSSQVMLTEIGENILLLDYRSLEYTFTKLIEALNPDEQKTFLELAEKGTRQL